MLVNHFLRKYGEFYRREQVHVSSECMQALANYSWPGNVRQLENLLKQLVVRQDEAVVFETIRNSPETPLPERTARHAIPNPSIVTQGSGSQTAVADDKNYSLKDRLSRTIESEEKRLIAEVLRRTNWNRRKAAQMLEISYRSLLYKIKEYRLNEVE